MDTHYFGTLSVVRGFAPQIAANGGGAILNILSGLSWVSFPEIGAYCAAKSAEWSLTNALRVQLAGQGIRVADSTSATWTPTWSGRSPRQSPTPPTSPGSPSTACATSAYEILADNAAHQAQAALAAGVSALYPQLP